MAQKNKQEKVATQVREDSKRSTAGDEPFAGKGTNPDEARKPQVGTPVTSTFDERTGVAYPWLQADGVQDNGAVNPEEAEGARRETTREGDNTTAEETKTAIEEGTVEGSVKDIEDLEKARTEAPKNPVN